MVPAYPAHAAAVLVRDHVAAWAEKERSGITARFERSKSAQRRPRAGEFERLGVQFANRRRFCIHEPAAVPWPSYRARDAAACGAEQPSQPALTIGPAWPLSDITSHDRPTGSRGCISRRGATTRPSRQRRRRGCFAAEGATANSPGIGSPRTREQAAAEVRGRRGRVALCHASNPAARISRDDRIRAWRPSRRAIALATWRSSRAVGTADGQLTGMPGRHFAVYPAPIAAIQASERSSASWC